MIVQILLVLVGLGLVVMGAEWLVDGASSIARRSGVSEFVIGVTIVGFGTSCPELVVSMTGAFEGLSAIAIGNVLGSNIFNNLLILGVTALITPVAISSRNKKRDIPFAVAITLGFILLGMNKTLLGLGEADTLSRLEGLLFLLVFAAYIWNCFAKDKPDSPEEGAGKEKVYGTWASIGLVLAGLAGLIFGGRLFVDSSVNIARAIGASEKFIAITILAVGTSLPEFVTCVIAASRRKDQLALGNVLGSNIFNVLLILGCSTMVTPLSMSSLNYVDVVTLVLSTVLILAWAFTGRKNRIDRWEGAILLALFIAYMTYLFITL